MSELHDIAKAMVAPYKGILAADESNSTAGKRLASINMESTEENRRQYRELFLGTEGIEDYLSGVILYDETIRQSMADGTPFTKHLQNIGVIPGIKVDMGIQDLYNFPEEKYTAGLDGLRERLAEYYKMGARFTKWRAVTTINETLPTETCIQTNAHIMALYAGLCQEAGLVPIVEPEVIITGIHDINRSYDVTSRVLEALFTQLKAYKIDLAGLILKTSMVISGQECTTQADAATVADYTVRCLKNIAPAEIGGIVFLSGGQSAEQSTKNLDAINRAATDAPWQLTFSYARALQGPSLKLWNGKDSNIPEARMKFLERLRANSSARMGEHDSLKKV